MPLYEFQCQGCGYKVEEFFHISDIPDKIMGCTICGRADAELLQIVSLPHTSMKGYHKPIELHSLGLAHADEIEAFRHRNPDVSISTNPNDPVYGVPMARSRKEKLDILKREKFVETK